MLSKKSHPKGHILYDFIYITFKNDKNGAQIRGCQGLGTGRRGQLEKRNLKDPVVMEILS